MGALNTSDNRRIRITFRGKPFVEFWVDKNKDGGFCFGPAFEGAPHLTVFVKNGKITYHITHEGSKEPSGEHPLGAYKPTKLVGDTLLRMIKGVYVPASYHGNRRCWVVTPERWEKIKSMQVKDDGKSDISLPLEYILGELDMDFSNKNLWQRVRIRSLVGLEPRLAFMESERGHLKQIIPVSRTQLLVVSPSKLVKAQKYFFAEVLGMKEFIDYVDQTEKGKRFFSEGKARLHEIAKEG